MQTFTQLLEAWGLAFVVLNVLADQSGLPVPSYPTLIAASAFAPQAGYSPVHVAVLAVVSALVADAAWYVAGLRKGRSVLCGLCRATRMPDACVRSTESAFLRFGLPSLLVVKFLPGFSALSATLAGATRMSPARYFAVDIGGAVIWAGTAVVLGVVFHEVVADAIIALTQFGRYAALAIAMALGSYLAVRAYRGRSSQPASADDSASAP